MYIGIMFMKYVSLPVFLISLAFGLFFVYIYGEDLKPIYVYPTPENVNKILYQDKADNCFQYKAMETECTADAKDLSVQA
jgi:hypothetical protein